MIPLDLAERIFRAFDQEELIEWEAGGLAFAMDHDGDLGIWEGDEHITTIEDIDRMEIVGTDLLVYTKGDVGLAFAIEEVEG